jgi:hypothetical protein
MYSDRSLLSQIKLFNVIDLYQIIEERYFPFITPELRLEFFNDKKRDYITQRLTDLLIFCDLKKDGGAT